MLHIAEEGGGGRERGGEGKRERGGEEREEMSCFEVMKLLLWLQYEYLKQTA